MNAAIIPGVTVLTSVSAIFGVLSVRIDVPINGVVVNVSEVLHVAITDYAVVRQ